MQPNLELRSVNQGGLGLLAGTESKSGCGGRGVMWNTWRLWSCQKSHIWEWLMLGSEALSFSILITSHWAVPSSRVTSLTLQVYTLQLDAVITFFLPTEHTLFTFSAPLSQKPDVALFVLPLLKFTLLGNQHTRATLWWCIQRGGDVKKTHSAMTSTAKLKVNGVFIHI